MYDTDEMTDDLRERLAAVQVPAPPRLSDIAARGRARRRHRLYAVAGLSMAGAAAATAAAVVNVGGGSPPAPAPVANHPARPAVRPVAPREIRTAAFTLVRHADGSVTLTIDPTELFDPAALQNDLVQDGIPAQVTSGKICTSDPAPADVSHFVVWHRAAQPGAGDVITIDPSGLPAGADLSFGTVGLPGDVQAAEFTVVDPNAVTCSTSPITDTPGQPGHGALYRITPSN